ncbi:10933_t:CDS:2 [Funneliformis geosporum]|uniref:10933_t:CDS:1 n=1 Tax=Funneliformis geosporum TaxID=1117311 RepID=A0A9W4T674_9GLOM|nr:10933_t:CDS:2 [Funneliformis geosporum]
MEIAKDYANDIKPSDLDQEDYNEILNMVRQIKELEKVKREQRQQNIENIKLNNPQIFGQSRCSTDRRNEISVPDNHIALTNVLFDDAEAQRLIKQDKDNGRYYINYHTYVDLNDKITIDHYQHYQANGQQGLAKPVSGTNELVENSDQQNMAGGLIVHQEKEKSPEQVDNEFILQYFQDHDIKRISLNPEGNLLVEYNSGKSQVIFNKQANNKELQKLIAYYQKSGQTSLTQQDLVNANNSNSITPKNTNNHTLLISLGLGGALIIGLVIGLWLRKNKVKKH